jgi:large conductance mechanosensitive channel
MSWVKEFKQFLMRGNAIDLAVAVVIGASFGAVVNALVADLVTPLIAAVGGQPDFSSLQFTINNSTFAYGDFINKLFSFVMVSAVIFFLIIKPVNLLMSRIRHEVHVEPDMRKCPECLADVPAQASRCMYCTIVLEPEV